MEFQIDASGPIYRQLVEQILARIKTGELQPGDRLPTERELAAQLGVARGTVKKAYRELADNNIIEVIQGSGSYVYDDRDVFNSERRRIAMQLVDETIAKLDLWDFSVQEIETMLRISLAKRERTDRLVRVAVVDCNPESLSIHRDPLRPDRPEPGGQRRQAAPGGYGPFPPHHRQHHHPAQGDRHRHRVFQQQIRQPHHRAADLLFGPAADFRRQF